MSAFKYDIVLVEPEIPPNTGNAGRLCVATQSRLHLVGKLGFSLDEKEVRRAGLDYWQYVELFRHDNLDAWFEWWNKESPNSPFYLLSKKAKHCVFDTEIPAKAAFIFGKETQGLPDDVLSKYSSHAFSIPMYSDRIRSLNLSNAISIVLYEAIRQQR